LYFDGRAHPLEDLLKKRAARALEDLLIRLKPNVFNNHKQQKAKA